MKLTAQNNYRQRKSARLPDYDYTSPGMYYVTICTYLKMYAFGGLNAGKLELNALGQLVNDTWMGMPERFANIRLDHWVVMPNHFHGILIITTGKEYRQPNQSGKTTPPPTLGSIIRAFKGLVTYHIHQQGYTDFAWQRRFHDHLIRDTEDLNRIRQYILDNPTRWCQEHKEMTNVYFPSIAPPSAWPLAK